MPAYKLPQSVLVVIHTPALEVLLIRRIDAGTWQSVTGSKDHEAESFWDTAVREVHEEVGVWVRDVRYVRSQPWPFPNSLMLGFRASYVSGDIVCDTTEIADANWYSRDDLPMIPGSISIARRLIDDWLLQR